MQALFDRLGITDLDNLEASRTTMVVRIVNEAKDRVVTSAKWPFLESSTALTVGDSARNYLLGADVGNILAIYDSTGAPLEPVERVTYDRLYRADVSTADSPVVFTREHFATTAAPNVHVWKSPQVTSVLVLQYMVRVPDLTDAASAQSFEHIPANMTVAITEAAEAAFHEWESSPQAPSLEAKFQSTLGRMVQAYAAPVIDDGTR